jgi:hypothetical protein
MEDITHIEIRMYGTGTGDCFIIKYFSEDSYVFSMMIDGGTWKGEKSHLNKYVKDLKKYVNNKIDLLIITHEHKDHLYLFDACENLFTSNFKVGEIWMAWTEDESDELAKELKDLYGQKKRALALASERVKNLVNDEEFRKRFASEFNNQAINDIYDSFASALSDFEELHFSIENGVYKGDLKGMKIIKEKIASNNIRFFEPGNIEVIQNLPGIKFYFLGPPRSISAIKKEEGAKTGDTYDHNKILRRSNSFSAAVSADNGSIHEYSPFSTKYFDTVNKSRSFYESDQHAWRRIDQDWLILGTGNLALRLNSGLNNLSLVFAIEIEKTKDVLLFTGDAEFGNWESWHDIEWGISGEGGKYLTEDILNRTIFYKVAHHLSHNGTAKEKGLRMMKSEKLISMASLDYKIISSNWKSTMPNRGILKDLISQTKGRLIIMNEEDLFYDFKNQEPLKDKIEKARSNLSNKEKEEFDNNYEVAPLYKQVTIKV